MNQFGKLILSQSDGQEQNFVLQKSTVILGRGTTSDITLADAKVSRVHARLECSSAGCTLVDLDSANGLLINGERVERALLTAGDVIGLGDSTLRFEVAAPELESMTVAIDSEAELDATLRQATVPMSLIDTQTPRLTIHTRTRTWEVPLNTEALTIGRHASSDLLLDQGNASRHHARIERVGDRFRIRDLDSTNGTWLGARRIDAHVLYNGDTLRIGDAHLVFKDGLELDDLTLVEESRPSTRAGLAQPCPPVVFIPGMMGSDLWRGSERLWPNTRTLFTQPELLKLQENDQAEARNIIEDVVIVPNLIRLQRYGRMGDFMEEALGYRRGENLLEFVYDWRRDNRHAAQRLAEAIDQWPVVPPITIIAHSGGCLVARYYVERLGGKQKVGRLILVGGPQHGCPKGISNLLSGPDFLPFGLLGGRVQEALATFPSMYQILPTYPCVVDQSGRPIDVYRDESWLPEHLHPLLRDARAFRREMGVRSSVSTTSIFGYGLKTPTSISVQRNRDGQWAKVELDSNDEGDATIPTASAVLEGSEIHPVQQHHGSLYVDNDVKMRLKWELTRS